MGDESHVRFVDAHAKGNGRHHDDRIVAHEPTQMLPTRLMLLVGVIRERIDAFVDEKLGDLLNGLLREAINNARVPRMLFLNELHELLARDCPAPQSDTECWGDRSSR